MCRPKLTSTRRSSPALPLPPSSSAIEPSQRLVYPSSSPLPYWRWSRITGSDVHIWTLPKHVSQSRFGGRDETSYACVFIALMLTKYLHRTGYNLPDGRRFKWKQPLPLAEWLMHILANAIIEGNKYHLKGKEMKKNSGKDKNLFTIPEAIKAIGGLNEIDFRGFGTCCKLERQIRTAIWNKDLMKFKQLYFVTLIDQQAFLICYDRDVNVLCLIDGHAHNVHGAIILMANYENLSSFCSTIMDQLIGEYGFRYSYLPKTEISLVQVTSDIELEGVLSAKPTYLKPMKTMVFLEHERTYTSELENDTSKE